MSEKNYLPPEDFNQQPNLPPVADHKAMMEKLAMAEQAFAKHQPRQPEINPDVDATTTEQPTEELPRAERVAQPEHTPMFNDVTVDAPDTKSDNPLAQYFRKSGLQVHLPTRGVFYSQDDGISLNQFGQVSVRPMSAADELLLKSPDALFNGEAVSGVIKSCCPDIENPKKLLTPDIEVLLIAIRVASQGDDMDFETTCPECGTSNEFTANVRELLENIQFLAPEYKFTTTDGLVVELHPYDFNSNVKASIATYEEARFLHQIDEKMPDDEKNTLLRQSFERMNQVNMNLISKSIKQIVTPDGTAVDNPAHILEFIINTSSKNYKGIENMIKEMNGTGVDKKFTAVCSNCDHSWETEVSFDPSHFFE